MIHINHDMQEKLIRLLVQSEVMGITIKSLVIDQNNFKCLEEELMYINYVKTVDGGIELIGPSGPVVVRGIK
jgi:hypothetical protein